MADLEFPEDLLALQQARVRLYNRMVHHPELRVTAAGELARRGMAVSRHPYWREPPRP
ncbi:hypothetical protein [Streptomyces sp. NPDC089915]|uniref:hypothetical protein n=1 Tax=Streptomyces sp. NPDC089915 TaxID=3155186 RepID=UPI003418D6A0